MDLHRAPTVLMIGVLIATVPASSASANELGVDCSQSISSQIGGHAKCDGQGCHERTDMTWSRCRAGPVDTNEVWWTCFDQGNDPDDDGILELPCPI